MTVSLYKSAGPGVPVRGAKKAVRGFYDPWTRAESDALRAELYRQVAERSKCETPPYDPSDQMAGYRVLTQLGDPFGSLDDVDEFIVQQTLKALFSKDEDLRSPLDREQAALDSFLKAEETCRKVNEDLSGPRLLHNGEAGRILFYARQKIGLVLGRAPSLSELFPLFGPGAATSCRNRTTARWKLSSVPSTSEGALKFVPELKAIFPGWLNGRDVVVEPAEISFVPKNYKTHRSICIEPLLNGFVQKGIGAFMKQKLLVSGVDLYNQGHNRERACIGSRDGTYATIDLERASDSVAAMLVLDLLPIDWVELLDSWRSPAVYFRKQNEIRVLEKFSSQGNAFTFELESTIFYGLAYGVAKTYGIPFDVTVYGDDIVCNSDLAGPLMEWLPRFGFFPNMDKSYSEGPFRESCGGDFVNGLDVRPYYLKSRFSYAQVVVFYNFLMRKEHFDPGRKLRDRLLNSLPEKYRLFGPDGFGDGHLISKSQSLDYLKPHKRKHG